MEESRLTHEEHAVLGSCRSGAPLTREAAGSSDTRLHNALVPSSVLLAIVPNIHTQENTEASSYNSPFRQRLLNIHAVLPGVPAECVSVVVLKV